MAAETWSHASLLAGLVIVDVVALDGRGRLSLGKIATHDRYLVRQEAGGVIVLEPAVVMTVAQANLERLPDLSVKLADSAAHPERAVLRRRRS